MPGPRPHLAKYRIQPGQVLNPTGRPKALLTKADVELAFQKFASMTKEELRQVTLDPKATSMQLMIASVMIRAIEDGDYSRMNFLLDRAVGKVKDESVVEQHTHDHKELLRGVPTKEIVKLLDKDPDK